MKSPVIHDIEKISFSPPEQFTLANNLSVYGFNGAKNDILRIDIVFDSGRWTEPAALIAESVSKLFKSGTATSTSFELNEQIESYGSTIRASSGYNTFTVSAYCMNRFLEPTLQLLRTCLTEIVFPKNEIELLQKNALSKLKVRNSRSVKQARSTSATAGSSSTTTTRRRRRRPAWATGGAPSAMSAASTRTASCTSPTARPT